MTWLTAIPVLGSFLEGLGEAIDELVTSDEERLKLRSEITSKIIPLLTTILDAEKHANDLRARLLEAELQHPHWLVWARRPLISIWGTLQATVAFYLYLLGYLGWDATAAMLAFGGALSGLDIASRGVEKTIQAFKAKEA